MKVHDTHTDRHITKSNSSIQVYPKFCHNPYFMMLHFNPGYVTTNMGLIVTLTPVNYHNPPDHAQRVY